MSGFVCYVGIDLGSTTTKAVVARRPRARVLGRGITNSRSQLRPGLRDRAERGLRRRADRAASAARSSAHPVLGARTPARSARRSSAPSATASTPAELACRVRRTSLAICVGARAGASAALERDPRRDGGAGGEEVLGARRRSARVEFFRDLAGAEFQRLAEAAAGARRGRRASTMLVGRLRQGDPRRGERDGRPDLRGQRPRRARAGPRALALGRAERWPTRRARCSTTSLERPPVVGRQRRHRATGARASPSRRSASGPRSSATASARTRCSRGRARCSTSAARTPRPSRSTATASSRASR